eukprot:Gb_37799 [translate_table: standard]
MGLKDQKLNLRFNVFFLFLFWGFVTSIFYRAGLRRPRRAREGCAALPGHAGVQKTARRQGRRRRGLVRPPNNPTQEEKARRPDRDKVEPLSRGRAVEKKIERWGSLAIPTVHTNGYRDLNEGGAVSNIKRESMERDREQTRDETIKKFNENAQTHPKNEF